MKMSFGKFEMVFTAEVKEKVEQAFRKQYAYECGGEDDKYFQKAELKLVVAFDQYLEAEQWFEGEHAFYLERVVVSWETVLGEEFAPAYE